MMKTILWYQGKSTDSADVYLLNGEIVTDENQRRLLIRELSSYRETRYHEINFKKAKEERRLSENAIISQTDNGIFVSSNYETTDAVGRKIVYEFYCESKDISIVLNKLVTISEKQDKECAETELKEIRNVYMEPEIHNMSKTTILLILVILGLLLFFIQY